MKTKTRKVKEKEYREKYSDIPIDYYERLSWMYDKYKITDKKADEIINKRNEMLYSLYYNDINIVLFEEPEGTPRSRFRIINRQNFTQAAKDMSQFVHVYSPNAKDDHLFMKRLTEEELDYLDSLICTPCIIEYKTFHKTPSSFNSVDTFLAEIGLIRPINKPDWDNIGKKYSDMSNHNIWLDDIFVIEGTVKKYYSILPRVEIGIRYLNMVYNKNQYNAITNRKDYNEYKCNLSYFDYSKTPIK